MNKNSSVSRGIAKKVIFSLLGFFVLLVLLLPTLASTDAGKRIIFDSIKNHYHLPGRLDAETLNLTWLGPQTLEGFQWQKDHETLLSLDKASLNTSLIKILRRDFGLQEANIENLNVDLTSIVKDRNFSLGDFPKLLNVNLNLKEQNQKYLVNIQGNTSFGNKSGRIDLKGEIDPKFLNETFRIVGKLENFPVLFLDNLVSFKNKDFSGLISEALGPTINAAINGNGKQTEVSVKTDRGNGRFALSFSDKGISLIENSYIKTELTPKFFEILLNKKGVLSEIKLSRPTSLDVNLDYLFYPWRSGKDNELIQVKGNFNVGPFEIQESSKLAKIEINTLNGKIQTVQDSNEMNFQLQGQGFQNKKEIKLFVDAEVEKSDSLSSLIDNLRQNAKFRLETTSLPLSLFNGVPEWDLISSFLGSAVNLKTVLNLKDGEGEAYLSLASDKVFFEPIHLNLSQTQVALKEPFRFGFNLMPETLKKLGSTPIVLKQALPIEGEVQKFDLSLFKDADLFEAISRSEIKLQIASSKKSTLSFQDELVDIEAFNANIHQRQNGKADIQAQVYLEPQEKSTLSYILDKKSRLDLVGTLKNLYTDHASFKLNAHLENSLLESGLALEISAKGIEILSPSFANYKLTEKAFKNFGGAYGEMISLQEPTLLQFVLSPLNEKINFENPHFIGKLNVDTIRLKSLKNQFALKDITIPLEVSSRDKKLKFGFQFSGKTSFENLSSEGVFSGRASFKALENTDKPLIEMEPKLKLYVENAPPEILTGLSPLLPSFINGPLELQVNFEMPEKDNGLFLIKSNSKDFNLNLSLRLENTIKLYDDADSFIRTTLDNDKIQALAQFLQNDELKAFSLAPGAELKIHLKKFELPKRGFLTSGFLNELGKANLALLIGIDNLYVRNEKTLGEAQISEFKTSIYGNELGKRLDIESHLKVKDKPLFLRGSIENLFNGRQLDLGNSHIVLNLNSHNFPNEVLNLIPSESISYGSFMKGLFGEETKASLVADVKSSNGPIRLNFEGGNGFLILDGSLNQGYLTLNSPLRLSFMPNRYLSENVLSRFSETLGKLEPSEDAIDLIVDSGGFSLPLSSNLRGIKIQRGSLSIQRQSFKNSPDLQALLGLFKNASENNVSIWLTPLYFSINDGIATLYRFDLLLNDRFHLASWGRVNLIDNKADMIIGITEGALREAFGITDLASDFMVQIPLKGHFSNLKLEKKKAAAKISSLVAQSQGPQGMILGTFLDLASGNDPTPPKPTTYPFPWGGEIQTQNEREPAVFDLKPVEKQIEKGVEKIEKGAKKLFRKIFQ